MRPFGLLLIVGAVIASVFVPWPAVIVCWFVSMLGGLAFGGAFDD